MNERLQNKCLNFFSFYDVTGEACRKIRFKSIMRCPRFVWEKEAFFWFVVCSLERPMLASRRRVFLCFYSAIFQLTSAKVQTFAYNSRTVWSSYMKFWQRFKINELYVYTKFRGNRSRDFGFRTRKPPRKFGVESCLIQKRLQYGKKYFTWLYQWHKTRWYATLFAILSPLCFFIMRIFALSLPALICWQWLYCTALALLNNQQVGIIIKIVVSKSSSFA